MKTNILQSINIYMYIYAHTKITLENVYHSLWYLVKNSYLNLSLVFMMDDMTYLLKDRLLI